MRSILPHAVVAVVLFASAAISSAVTYGNSVPFTTNAVLCGSQNNVIGIEVNLPEETVVESFGVVYGIPELNLLPANAVFGLYADTVGSTLPNRIAATNPILLDESNTYDEIPFTSTPTVPAGRYWMVGLFSSTPTVRCRTGDFSVVVAWPNPYANGMPPVAPPSIEFFLGANFNFWINGEPVPEPATVTQLAGGIAALAFAARRRRRASSGRSR